MQKKQQDEVRLLKQVIQRLCSKLKDYQKQFNSNKALLATEQAQVEQIVNSPLVDGAHLAGSDENNVRGHIDDPAIDTINDGFAQLLGGHTIGPLVQEYEDHIGALTKEIK